MYVCDTIVCGYINLELLKAASKRIVTFLPFKNVYYLISIIANQSKSQILVFVLIKFSLLFTLLMYHCTTSRYNNNYNYNRFTDAAICNRNSLLKRNCNSLVRTQLVANQTLNESIALFSPFIA